MRDRGRDGRGVRTIALTACLGTLVGGCAGFRSVATPALHSRVFDASYEQTWDAVGDVLTELMYVIRSRNTARGVMVAERHCPAAAVGEYAADPIGSISAPWWSLEVTLIVSVQQVSPAQTRVTTNSRLIGRISEVVPTAKRSGLNLVPLRSNGTIEGELFEHLATTLRNPRPPRQSRVGR